MGKSSDERDKWKERRNKRRKMTKEEEERAKVNGETSNRPLID
jgi:hypothetical protein